MGLVYLHMCCVRKTYKYIHSYLVSCNLKQTLIIRVKMKEASLPLCVRHQQGNVCMPVARVEADGTACKTVRFMTPCTLVDTAITALRA
jgi:hypothetical protein